MIGSIGCGGVGVVPGLVDEEVSSNFSSNCLILECLYRRR